MDPALLITTASSSFRWPSSRRKVYLRRRKSQVIRLGGRNGKVRGRFSLKRMVTRMKFKWLRLYYVRLVKKIKGYYRDLVKEFVEAGASSTMQDRMMVEAAAFAAPGLGLSFYPSAGEHRPRFFLV